MSKAFQGFVLKSPYRTIEDPFGTVVTVDGTEIAEVAAIHRGKRVHVRANWIPEDPGHSAVLRAIETGTPLDVEIRLPIGVDLKFPSVQLTGCATIDAGRQAMLWFSFPAATHR
jgi:hypothetical protein